MRLARGVILLLVAGIALGFLIAAGLFAVDVSDHLSTREVFDRIQLGMDREEAISVLGQGEVLCELTVSTGNSSCHFSDYWRDYQIVLDRDTGKVFSKIFAFRKRKYISERVSRMLDALPNLFDTVNEPK